MLGHGAAAVPHGPKEVGAWVFVPPSRLRHAVPTAPLPSPSPTPEPSACAAAAPEATDGVRDYLGAVLQQKPPLSKPPRTKPLPVRRGLRSPKPLAAGQAEPAVLCPSSGVGTPQGRPASGTVERHRSLLEPLAKRPRRDPRPRSHLMQRQRAFSLEKRAMQGGAVPAAAC